MERTGCQPTRRSSGRKRARRHSQQEPQAVIAARARGRETRNRTFSSRDRSGASGTCRAANAASAAVHLRRDRRLRDGHRGPRHHARGQRNPTASHGNTCARAAACQCGAPSHRRAFLFRRPDHFTGSGETVACADGKAASRGRLEAQVKKVTVVGWVLTSLTRGAARSGPPGWESPTDRREIGRIRTDRICLA